MRFEPPLAALFLVLGSLSAQVGLITLAVEDRSPAVIVAPLPEGSAAIDVVVHRAWLTPDARESLSTTSGMPSVVTISPGGSGPAILGRRGLSRIPGDRRLRAECGDLAVSALGVGASVEESIRHAVEEPLPRCVLVGVASDAVPPRLWSRVGPVGAEPGIWVRGIEVLADFTSDGRRVLQLASVPATRSDPGATRQPGAVSGGAKGNDVAPEHPELRAGPFPEHLQGIARDPAGNLFWSWTDQLVKTTARGTEVRRIPVESHHGDLTWNAGRVVVAVNLGQFNDSGERHDSWAYVYGGESLAFEAKHPLAQCRFGAGGICWNGTHYVVVTGLPVELADDEAAANEVHLYDSDFCFVRTLRLSGGWTRLGIQTAEFAHGRFVFGCYGTPRCVLVASPDLLHVQRIDGVDAAYGVVALPSGQALFAVGRRDHAGHFATLRLAPIGIPFP